MNMHGVQLSIILLGPMNLLQFVYYYLKAYPLPLSLLHACQGSQSNINSTRFICFDYTQAIHIFMQLAQMASLLSENTGKVVVYLTKKTVSLQNDSSQLGPGTTSAHKGNRWWGRVTLRVKRNSRSAAVTRVSSRMTQDEVKSGVNLITRDSFSWTLMS